jgi:predicted RNase H-like nuclease (RuvC/YqgF family)
MNAQEIVRSAITDLSMMRDQIGGIEDLNAERAKAEHNLQLWTHNVKMMKSEFDEVKRAHDKLVKEAWEKQREVERLTTELREKTAQRDQISAELQRLRQQFGG